jgi:hypothetical protein
MMSNAVDANLSHSSRNDEKDRDLTGRRLSVPRRYVVPEVAEDARQGAENSQQPGDHAPGQEHPGQSPDR